MSKHPHDAGPTHTPSPNAIKWQKWVAGNDATNTLPDFAAGQALLNGPTPAPPSTAFLFTLPGDVWPGWLHNTKQHALTLTGVDRDAALANLNRANQLYNLEGGPKSVPLACYPLVNGALDIAHPILGSTSWPSGVVTIPSGVSADTSTDAGVLSLCGTLRMPGADPNAPPFPHVGGG